MEEGKKATILLPRQQQGWTGGLCGLWLAVASGRRNEDQSKDQPRLCGLLISLYSRPSKAIFTHFTCGDFTFAESVCEKSRNLEARNELRLFHGASRYRTLFLGDDD